jgi:molybdenum ABC transporter molybdate-binding protein
MNGLKMFLGSVVIVGGLVAALMWDGEEESSLDTIHVYCAAGMRKPVQAAADRYQKEFGIKVELDFDGSGTLLGKLKEEYRSGKSSKRGDLYLAADESYIAEARSRGLVDEGIPLAWMRPVIAVKKGSPKGIRGIADLLRAEVKVAVCNPEQAAVGRTARAVLKKLGHWDALVEKIHVMKPKVTDLANDVKLGSVDAAIVWDSTVSMYPELEAIRVPEFEATKMLVTIGVTSFTRSPVSALRFARYLAARDRGLEDFKTHGFDVVEGDVWEKRPQLVVWSGGVNRLAAEKTIEEFGRREGVEIVTKYGGCGTLTAEMKTLVGTSNFPDVYFACDRSYMTNVSDWYLSSVLVSETDMVIAVPKGNPKSIKALEDLTQNGLELGIADPEKSALGRLTERLFRGAGIFDQVMRNVRVTDGTADMLVNKIMISRGHSIDAVIVYRANLPNVLDRVTVVEIDHKDALAEQPIAMSVVSSRKETARRFIKAIVSKRSEQRFRDVGFRWRHGEEGSKSEAGSP